MKNFRLLIWGAAACGAAVLTGCVQTADNQLSPMEKDWERVIRSSYPGYRTPKTTAPAQRDGVVDYRVPAAQTAADNSMTAASTDPVPVEDPVSAVDKAAAADPSSEIKEPAMPVPAPATAELLQGLPQEKGKVAKELTTPTGAALAKVLGETALELPEGFTCEKIAYGAGTWELEIPNVLRVHVGTVANEKSDSILEVACNIDDMSGEVFAYVIERLLLAGALDAWAEPIVMKKGRPAYKLVFLVSEAKLVSLLDVVFEETTTLGVRYHKVERSTLERKSMVVATPFGSVAVKYGFCNGAIVNIAPEFDSCKEIAANAKISLKKAMQYAQIAAEDLLNE